MNIRSGELQNLYAIENLIRLKNIENNILEIEECGFDQAVYEAIMRELHTMKGDSGSLGLHLVSDLCHQMEEIFVKDCNWEGEDISEKVTIILNFVDVISSFLNDTLPSPANEEMLKSFLFDLIMKYSWTAQPFGSDRIHLRQSESLVIGEKVVIRPLSIENKMLFDQLHQDLIDMRDNLFNKTLVLDLTNFERVPLCMNGWAFALKEELAKNNSRLIIMGLKPYAVSLTTRQKMVIHFDIKEKLSDVIHLSSCD